MLEDLSSILNDNLISQTWISDVASVEVVITPVSSWSVNIFSRIYDCRLRVNMCLKSQDGDSLGTNLISFDWPQKFVGIDCSFAIIWCSLVASATFFCLVAVQLSSGLLLCKYKPAQKDCEVKYESWHKVGQTVIVAWLSQCSQTLAAQATDLTWAS